MEHKETGANISLKRIEERDFSLNITPVSKDISDVDFALKFGFVPDTSKNSIYASIRVVTSTLDKVQVLQCELGLLFRIEQLSKYVRQTENGLVVDAVIPHILNVSIGTVRGWIAARVSGTPLSQFPLPVFDPNEMLNSEQ